jgi:hypothetical protein
MESDASVNNRVEDACARDCRRTPKALFQFEQALPLLLQSGTVFRGIVETAEPCLFQWRQHDYIVLLKAYEFEGETNHLPYRPHKEKGDSWGSIMLVCMRRGAKPAELPVQPVKVELVLNLKGAFLTSRYSAKRERTEPTATADIVGSVCGLSRKSLGIEMPRYRRSRRYSCFDHPARSRRTVIPRSKQGGRPSALVMATTLVI